MNQRIRRATLPGVAVVNLLLVLTIMASWALSLASVYRAGPGWDAALELDLAAIALGPLPLDLQASYEATPYLFEFYGVIGFQAIDAATRAIIGESLFALGAPQALTSLRIGNALLGLLGVSVLALAIGRNFRSATYGLLYLALISSWPLWNGHLGFNTKDVPVAAGLSIVSAGIIALRRPSKTLEVAAWLSSIAFGTFIVVGSRPVAVAFVIAVLLSVVVVLYGRIRLLMLVAFSALVGIGCVLALNPYGRRGFLNWIVDAFLTSNLESSLVRFAGIDVQSGALPLTYVPGWIAAQMPLMLLFVTVASCCMGFWMFVRMRPRDCSSPWVSILPLLIQGLLLPILVVASQQILYDATRHLLFIYPALAILPLMAVAFVGKFRSMRLKSAFTGLIVLTTLSSLFACVRWFPYQYAFVNPIAGAIGEGQAWELDYWGVSVPEGMNRLRAEGNSVIAVLPSNDPGEAYGALDWGDTTHELAEIDAVYIFYRYNAQLPATCQPRFEITRDGNVLGVGGEC